MGAREEKGALVGIKKKSHILNHPSFKKQDAKPEDCDQNETRGLRFFIQEMWQVGIKIWLSIERGVGTDNVREGDSGEQGKGGGTCSARNRRG